MSKAGTRRFGFSLQEAAMSAHIFGPAFEESSDRERVLTQLEVIRDVMLSAAECAEAFALRPYRLLWDPATLAENAGWMTLRELGELTNYGEASISAQLRHLRKKRFGGYIVDKRRRGLARHGAWEYRIAGRRDPFQLTPLFAGAHM
jgi:hypothetical protein